MQAVTLAGGTATAQLISVVFAPILTRLYAPDEMGALAGMMAVVAVMGVVAAARYDLAIVLPEFKYQALGVAASGLLAAIGMAMLLVVVVGLRGTTLGPLMGLEPTNWYWLWLIPAIVFLVGAENVFVQLHVRIRQFRPLATAQILQQLAASATKVGLGIGGFGVVGLFVGTLAGHLVRVGSMLRSAWAWIRSEPNAYRWSNVRQMASRYRKFPLLMSGSSLLSALSAHLPILLFASLLSSAVAGCYALGQSVLGMPMDLIGRNVGRIYLDRAARAQGNQADLARITWDLYLRLFLLGTLLFSVVMFHGQRIFPLVFGERWIEAGRYAQWMSVWLIFSFTAIPLNGLFAVLERQGEMLIWDAGLLALRTGIIWGGVAIYGNQASAIIAALSLGTAAAYLALTMRLIVLAGVRLRAVCGKMVVVSLFIIGAQYALWRIIEAVW